MPVLNHGLALLAVTSILAVANLASGELYADCEIDGSEAAQLTAEANRWLNSLGEAGLVLLKEEDEGAGFGENLSSGRGFGTFTYLSGDYWVSFGLSEEVSSQNVTLNTLKTTFRYFAVTRLPLPGFEKLDGWDVNPVTPISSFSEGVEFLSLSNGKVSLRVKTSFFAIYGSDRRIISQLPADSAAPLGSYFQVRRSFPLDLTLTAPLL